MLSARRAVLRCRSLVGPPTAAVVTLALLGALLATGSTLRATSPLLPGELAFYYGFPSQVNGSAGDLDAATSVFGDYDIVVFGDSLQFPQYTGAPGQEPYYGCDQNSHFDHDNTVEIISRLATPPNSSAAYGYVSIGGENTAWICPPDPVPAPLTMVEIKARVDAWDGMGVTGIFLDEAEYGFGSSRERQNEAVDYVHSKGLAAFINSWDPDDVFKAEVVDEVLYTTGYYAGSNSSIPMNPGATATHLGSNDLFLQEGFQVLASQFQDPPSWVARSDKASSFKSQFGTRMATVTTVSAAAPQFDQSKLDYAWWSTLLYGFDAMGWGELYFSAADDSLPFRSRPEPGEIGSAFTSAVTHASPEHTRTTTAGTIRVNTDTHSGGFDSDGDTVVDAVDNCPDTVNAGQENADGDQWGDVCDNCPATSTPWEVPSGDGDCDNWTDVDEGSIGTDAAVACDDGLGLPDWPPDFDDSQKVDIVDVFALKPVFNTSTGPPDFTSPRFDLAPSGTINIVDVFKIKPVFNESCT